MEIIISKSVFVLVAAVAAAGLFFDLGTFSGIFRPSCADDDRYRYWPVHLFLAVSSMCDFFSKDMALSVEIFAFQQAAAVVLSFLIKMRVAEGGRGRLFLVLAALFYTCALVVTMYEYMGHAYMASSRMWLYSYVLLLIAAFILYYYSFVDRSPSLLLENIVAAVLNGIISTGMLLLSLVAVIVVLESGCLYAGLAAGSAMYLVSVFFFVSSFRHDDMIFGSRARKAVSASIRTCMPQLGQNKKTMGTESELQKRFVAYFEEKKPYLNPELSMADVVNALYTNKTYLSRMLNEGMGMNFNQTVNKYRVMHSMELYIANPAMQISEMAEMSGFNSVSTFSLAFRLHVGLAPGDWCKTVRNGMSRSGKEPLVCED